MTLSYQIPYQPYVLDISAREPRGSRDDERSDMILLSYTLYLAQQITMWYGLQKGCDIFRNRGISVKFNLLEYIFLYIAFMLLVLKVLKTILTQPALSK